MDNNNTILNSNLFRYEPSSLSIHNGFSGRLVVNSSHAFDTKVVNYFVGLQTKTTGSCITGVSGNWECSDGNNHSPSDVDRDNGPCRVGGNVYYIDVEYGPCPTAGEEEMSFDFDAGNPRNGGGGISSGNNPCAPSLVVDCGNGTMPIAGDNGNAISPLTTAFLNSLTLTLTRTQLQFINDPAQESLVRQIDIFLAEEGHSPEAQALAIEAIIASEEGGDADFENKSIYDETVPDCLKDIVNAFKPSENGVALDFTNLDQSLLDALNLPGDILSLFDNDEGYAVKIKVEPNLVNSNGDPVNATTGQATLGNMSIITFNANYLNRATDLTIARTAIHELVHAYLQYIIQHVPNSELGESLDVLILQSNLGVLNGDPQHVLMAEQFVNAMALSLANSDGFQHPTIEYQKLAWSGAMRKSDAFESLDPNDQQAVRVRDQVESGLGHPVLNPLGIKNCP